MFYRISKWKMNGQETQSSKKRLIPLSALRAPVKPRPVAVVKPVIIDPREAVFRHFTEIPSIDLKTKSKWLYNPKSKTVNRFLEFLGMPDNKSTAVVVPTCRPTGVSALDKSPRPIQSTVVSDPNASSRCQVTEKMENGYQKPSAETPSNILRPMTRKVDTAHGPVAINDGIRRIYLERKVLVKKVDPIDFIVAKFSGLSLDDKRKVKESEKEYFEKFQAHRLHSRPYAKRIKVLNN